MQNNIIVILLEIFLKNNIIVILLEMFLNFFKIWICQNLIIQFYRNLNFKTLYFYSKYLNEIIHLNEYIQVHLSFKLEFHPYFKSLFFFLLFLINSYNRRNY